MVRLSGARAAAIAEPIVGPLPPARRAALRRFTDADGEAIDLGLVLHFDYDRPLANYLGKSGDTVAGIVLDLARIRNGSGQPESAAELINRLLREREAEINDQLLELLALQHARALHQSGRTAGAIAVLDRAIERYRGDWERRLREARSRYAAGGTGGDVRG